MTKARDAEIEVMKGGELVPLVGGSTIPAIVNEDPERIRGRIVFLKETIDTAYFELAQLLYHVWNGGDDGKPLWMGWGFKSFNEYVEKELDFGIRKAQYLIQIWNYFGIQQGGDLIDKVRGLGWSKVKELVGVVTPQNAETWVSKATEMTAPELADEARAILREQKISAAEAKKGPAAEPEAGIDAAEPPPEQEEEPSVPMSFKFTGGQARMVDDAVKRAMELGRTKVRSHALSLVCQDFLSTNEAMAAGAVSKKKAVAAVLKKFESLLGVRIIAVDLEAGDGGETILLGGDVIRKLAGSDSESGEQAA